MTELNNKQTDFCIRWEKRRQKKVRYVFLHGVVYWGLPMGVVLYFVLNQFKTENMDLSKFQTTLTIAAIAGLFYGISQYNKLEKIYLKICDDEDILQGIELVEAGKVWNYENLVVSKQDAETLVVKNKLFWLDDSDALSKNLDECLNIVMKDFERLKKDPEFDLFSSEYKVRVQVFDNSEKVTPLIEMTL